MHALAQRRAPPSTLLEWSGIRRWPVAVLAALLSTAIAAAAIAEGDGGATDPELAALEHEVETRIDALRRENSLKPFTYDGGLARMARAHSIEMAEGRRPVGHDGFGARQAEAFALVGANHTAENVTSNTEPIDATVAEAMKEWLDSRRHRAHLLGAYDRAGVGVARSQAGAFYFTLFMAGPWPIPAR